MQQNKKHRLIVTEMAILLLFLSLYAIFKQPDTYSDSERRVLTQSPKLSFDSVQSARFMGQFEDYATDQFPFRDDFRHVKATAQMHLFQKLDNNDIYTANGHLSKLEYPMNTAMLDHAAKRFSYLYKTYLKDSDTNLFFSIVPDKNKFLAAEHGYLSMDYDALASYMQKKTPYMQYIDIYELLEANDYYQTDTHWRQECIVDVAETLINGMQQQNNSGHMNLSEHSETLQNADSVKQMTAQENYTVQTLSQPFYGVYSGQSALHPKPDTLHYLTSDILDQCIVTSYDTGKPVPAAIYDMEAAAGKDPYEMFTSGSDALITIENPNAENKRELLLFRDSFGSSIAPLLAHAYSKITLIDIRYIQSRMLGNFIDFTDQDVLFLYSTMMLNNSMGMK